MEYWEFLLQKEGDRSWLPLESPDVEILEGRYRVVARSSRANTSVEIRITHQIADEVPPKRRAQKRFGRTNKDGLMVVFPFTRMKPGLWEIRCAGDLMSDFLGQSWQYNVCLQVLPQEFESETDWDSEWEMQEEAADSSSPANPVVTTTTAAHRDQEPIQPQTVAVSETDTIAPAPEVEVTVAQPESAVGTTAPAVPKNFSSTPHIAEATDYSVEQLQYIAERISESEASLLPEVDVEQASAAIASPTSEIPETSAIAEPTSPADDLLTPDAPEPAALEDYPLQLVLAQPAYMTSWGRPFTLSGRIELQESANPTTAIASLPAPVRSGEGELQVCLRDPQSAQILVEVRQPLTSQPLPYAFNCTLEIPLSCKTRLLLGEVAFHRPAIAPDPTEPSTLQAFIADRAVAIQSFTLTADVDELLDAIAADLSEEQLLDLPLPNTEVEPEPEPESEPVGDSTTEALPSERAYLNLSFLNLGEQSQSKQPFHIQPSTGSPLPPQIYRAQAESSKTPALPVIQGFYPASPELPLKVPDTPEPDEAVPAAVSEAVAEDLSPDATSDFVDLDSDLGDLGLADLETELPTTVDLLEDELPEAEPIATSEASDAPVETASQALNFQERFWARLNALASDTNLSEWLKEDDTDSSRTSDLADLAEPIATSDATAQDNTFASDIAIAPQSSEMIVHPTARPPEDEWVAQEIVVEDEPVVAAPQQSTTAAPEAPNPALLDPEEVVPNPQLEVPAGELVSGKPVTVRVRMPDLPCRIYVKFWVNDRQTRSLLDGPRWLVDFTPTGLGDLEATTQLTVPFGSLEIQFEAIAIEMATQRESHKVVAARMVVPPDTPTLSYPEWD